MSNEITNRIQTGTNPVIYSDFPDPDIIRIDDTYYMVSTTMYFMPGCDILRSYDLIHWEIIARVYDALDNTDGHHLKGEENIYGQGMWAPTIRYHNDKFYIAFTANDTHKTYLFVADQIEGPWEKRVIDGWFYDSSLFFDDDDDKVYILHGNRTLYLTQLKEDLSGPLEGGLHRIITVDREDANLGYEGSHMYKKDGSYYIFTCHFAKDEKKTEDVFISDSLTGDFKGRCLINDDMDWHGMGVAQGGMIDTIDGDWYLFMFQDRGALGRSPVIIPMEFDGKYPIIANNGRVPHAIQIPSTRPDHSYEPLNGNEFCDESGIKFRRLKNYWQFNHLPQDNYWSLSEDGKKFIITTGQISKTILQAPNTLTQRMVGPSCTGEVVLDGTNMKNGDIAGLCAFISNYGYIALTKEDEGYYLLMMGRKAKNESVFGDFDYMVSGTIYDKIKVDNAIVKLQVRADFTDLKDTASFYYYKDDEWVKLGIDQKMYFKLDLFTGCRYALFHYATKEIGGSVAFSEFKMGM